ncbi:MULTISPECIES: hypothetical protein [Bacillus]|uniref:hypothetical protein n=1 Tax=Bacillus TaxID=1386 RepID=UPI0008732948|nr:MULTISPECIES: hypothetical protein [Bacillus cereus group]OFD00854.1 hypothetical protein BTGOE7_57690 [Bacillus thuringiensis]MBJ8048771.1 hypothetical protein [Bacillus cereus group sp. N18]PEA31507.1 hypothetical protein COO13_19865 [Bacillus toyonensis]PEA65272.1 hypothetical protein COO18_18455 [Bacillus toyonensis]PEI64812.1 hypothetical protein CN674_31400 [Bacillus toyonensis]
MKKKKQNVAVLLSAGVIATSISLPISSYADTSNIILSTEKYNETIHFSEFISGQLTTSLSTKNENVVFRYNDENKDTYKLGIKNVQESSNIKKQEVNQALLSPQLGNHDYFIELGRRTPRA